MTGLAMFFKFMMKTTTMTTMMMMMIKIYYISGMYRNIGHVQRGRK